MATLRDLLNARAVTSAAVQADTVKLSADQAVVTLDQTQLSTDTAADASALAAIATGIADEPGDPGYVIDPVANADGTYTLYVQDKSPQGFHQLSIPSVDSPLPDVPATS